MEKTISLNRKHSEQESKTPRNNNELPLTVHLLADGEEFLENGDSGAAPTLELTSKQFQTAADVPIKSIIQLRQNTN